nr:hypothetical protein [Tanacetum cinerariifolium]
RTLCDRSLEKRHHRSAMERPCLAVADPGVLYGPDRAADHLRRIDQARALRGHARCADPARHHGSSTRVHRYAGQLATRIKRRPSVLLQNPFPAQSTAIVLAAEILLRPLRHNAGRVDGSVAAVVVMLDVLEVHGRVQFGEDFIECFFIRPLRSGETRAVHAVIHGRINTVVETVDLFTKRFRIQIQMIAGQVIERRVEHADDFRRLVADDAVQLLVPQHWHGDPACVVRGVGQITLVHERVTVERIPGGAGLRVEGPAVFAHQPTDDRDVDQALKALEFAHDQRAMRPRTGQRHIQVVAAGFGFEAAFARRAGASVGGDPVTALGLFTLERAVFAALVPLRSARSKASARGHGDQVIGIERGGFDVAAVRQSRPFLIPWLAVGGAIQMADRVRVDFNFAAVAFDHNRVVAQQTAGVAMHGLIARVKNTLQTAACAQRVENARQRVNWRAQAEGVAQVDHALQLRRPVSQRDECDVVLLQRLTHCLPVAAQRDAQQLQQLLTVKAAGGMRTAAMHQHSHPILRQAFGREQVPRQMTLLAGVGRPVDVYAELGCVQAFAHGFGKARQFIRALFLVPQQHEKRAELGVLDFFIEHHAHCFSGFGAGHVASAAFTFAQDTYEGCERVFVRGLGDEGGVVGHRQLVGFGRPASLAASLAGVPLNRRLRTNAAVRGFPNARESGLSLPPGPGLRLPLWTSHA